MKGTKEMKFFQTGFLDRIYRINRIKSWGCHPRPPKILLIMLILSKTFPRRPHKQAFYNGYACADCS